MVLIFGGTTEGRLAVDVCEQASAPYYYSTKGDLQQVALVHGVRLTGAMTADDIRCFCQQHGVRLIVDAAHPFAEGLHRAVADVGLPVVRIETRQRTPLPSGIIECSDFDDAVRRLCHDRPRRLLALTGVNSIARLADYWRGGGDTIFRILRRQESLQKAMDEGFPTEKLVFYESTSTLPTADEERRLMEQVECDAIITNQPHGILDRHRVDVAKERLVERDRFSLHGRGAFAVTLNGKQIHPLRKTRKNVGKH